jgi:hypothetical protein
MDRLAVPVQGEDVLAPFLPPAAARPPGGPGQRWRFEPRNMGFTDGLDRRELSETFPGAGQPHWQDYSCTAADRSAVLASAVPEPFGFRRPGPDRSTPTTTAATRTFRGELRTTGVAGRAGLHLVAGRAVDPPRVPTCATSAAAA